MFAVFGAFFGFIAVGTVGMLIQSVSRPDDRAHWLRVAMAALIGAGVGAYLGETRRRFILNCAAAVSGPFVPVLSVLGRHRDELRVALRLLMATLAVIAWIVWVVGPDWRLNRIIEHLQSPDEPSRVEAARELGEWRCGGIAALDRERDRMLVRLLSHDDSMVRASAAYVIGESDPPLGEAVPKLIELL